MLPAAVQESQECGLGKQKKTVTAQPSQVNVLGGGWTLPFI